MAAEDGGRTVPDLATDRSFLARADEIDAAWLERALAVRFPEVRIVACERVGVIVGAQAKVILRIETNQAGKDAGLPERVIVKTDIEEFGFGPVAHVLFNEPQTYSDIVPELPVEAPRTWATRSGNSGLSYTIMEDLTERGVEFCNLGEPLSPEVAARFLESLARIHARWWNSADLWDPARFGRLRRPMIGMYETYVRHHLSPEVFPHFAALPRAAATARVLRDPDRLRAALFKLRDFHQDMPHCVIHGDTHLNNLYVTAEGIPGFYDWSPRVAPWTHEVSYFLPAALDVPDRRKHEAELLRHYLAALAAQGVDAPGFEEAWLGYRRELAWGMFVFLINGPTQTEYANTAAASRFSVALVDHDCYGLLGV